MIFVYFQLGVNLLIGFKHRFRTEIIISKYLVNRDLHVLFRLFSHPLLNLPGRGRSPSFGFGNCFGTVHKSRRNHSVEDLPSFSRYYSITVMLQLRETEVPASEAK